MNFLTLCLSPSDFRSSALVYRDTFSYPPCKPHWSIPFSSHYLPIQDWISSLTTAKHGSPLKLGDYVSLPHYIFWGKRPSHFANVLIFLSSPVPDPQMLCDLINWVLSLHEAKIVPVLCRKLEIPRESSYCPMEKRMCKKIIQSCQQIIGATLKETTECQTS